MANKEPVKKRNYLENLTSILDKNIRGVQFGLYTVAVGGLIIAIRSVRPFQKFKLPNDIPENFFKRNVQLNGKVLRVEMFPKILLVIDHSPVIGNLLGKVNLKNKKKDGLLVNIEGVDISGNGISWLQSVVVGNNIDFVLLSKQIEYVNAIVYCKKYNAGNQLVSLGFASVGSYNIELDGNKIYKNYYQNLLKVESKAEKTGVGMWWETKKNNFIKSLFSKFYSVKL